MQEKDKLEKAVYLHFISKKQNQSWYRLKHLIKMIINYCVDLITIMNKFIQKIKRSIDVH